MRAIMFFALLVMVFNNIQLTSAFDRDKIHWNDIKTGITIAQQTNRKVLIDCSDNRCLSCAKMDALYKRPTVAKWVINNFVPVKCRPANNSIDWSFFQSLGGNSFPTTCVLDPVQNVVKDFSGYVDDSVAFENAVVHLLLKVEEAQTSTQVKNDVDREAIQACSDIIATDPNPESYDQRATAFYRLGELDDSIRDAKLAVLASPQEVEYRQSLILYLVADQKQDEAITTAQRATKDFPKNAWLFNELASLYMQKKESLDKEQSDSSHATDLDSLAKLTDDLSLENIRVAGQSKMEGLNALSKGDLRLAIHLLESVIANDPMNANLRHSLAAAYKQYSQSLMSSDPASNLDNFNKAKLLPAANLSVPDNIKQTDEQPLQSEAITTGKAPEIEAATIMYLPSRQSTTLKTNLSQPAKRAEQTLGKDPPPG